MLKAPFGRPAISKLRKDLNAILGLDTGNREERRTAKAFRFAFENETVPKGNTSRSAIDCIPPLIAARARAHRFPSGAGILLQDGANLHSCYWAKRRIGRGSVSLEAATTSATARFNSRVKAAANHRLGKKKEAALAKPQLLPGVCSMSELYGSTVEAGTPPKKFEKRSCYTSPAKPPTIRSTRAVPDSLLSRRRFTLGLAAAAGSPWSEAARQRLISICASSTTSLLTVLCTNVWWRCGRR